MAVASNKYQKAVDKIIPHFYPDIDFIAIEGHREGVNVKPDPSVVFSILARAGVAKADTLYVATGCLYANSTRYSGSSSGKTVRIPTHYFKALLYKGRDAAAKDTDGYLAAGFILPHDAGIAKGNFLDYICSIDELERQTGIDFFPNLVTRVGTEMANAIEASTPGTFWK